MNARRIFVRMFGSLLLVPGAGCNDSPTATPAAVAKTLQAASSINVTGTVGSLVTERPSVIVRDQNDLPMPGVRVLFSLVAGGGSITQGSVESDASGRATLSEWVLPTVPEKVVVAATTGLLRVEFRATTKPGPPVTLTKLAGDNQIAPPGSVVPIRPRVRVADAYNNPLASVTVLFAVAGGGGSLTGASVTTDASGIATLESWTLGAARDQSLMATIASLAPITFVAKTARPALSCGAVVQLPGATIFQSEMTAQGCASYTIALSEADTYEFKVSSTAFEGWLELRDLAGNEIAVSGWQSTSSSAIRAVLPAGSFTLVVSSVNPDAAGPFAVSYTRAAANKGGCDQAFIVRDVQLERIITEDCTQLETLSSGRFRIRLTAGSRIFAVLDDYSLSDNRFDVQNDYGYSIATAVVRNYQVSELDFIAPVDGYYTLRVDVVDRYRLTVR